MWITEAIFSAIIFGFASVVMKSSTMRNQIDQYLLWGLYLAGGIFFYTQCYKELYFSTNIFLYVWAVLIGLGSFYGNWFVIKALEVGPASLTAPMLSLNIPLIILMSVFVYHEEIDSIKIAIIVTLFAAIIIVKIDPNEKLVIKENKWFLWVILGSFFLFLREGGLKITQELNLNNTIVLLYSYIFCFILSSTAIIIKEKRLFLANKKSSYKSYNLRYLINIFKEKNRYHAVWYGLVTGLCSGLGLYLYSQALLTGPTSLVALIFSARSLVIVALSYIIHKERLSLFQKFSVILLCLGLSLASFIK
ncbi:EamA family transporter [Pigmentibacter sp. JX0631]|uniref:EamA family transporter n=1 Tax=Pigmentibacter sp. JX0631 TaxID=2976982 RepID=UPI0024692FDB|nr:EamA family transporter [Pigmentibacter sp. JX0631]WGL59257.1 EamA family transporter [Pigmentibacter sp. JX0631]